MINSYLAHLELRVVAIEKLLGDVKEFKESDIKDAREGINEIVSKLQKDVSRKCKFFFTQFNASKKLSKNMI